jgi:hypothetical protein
MVSERTGRRQRERDAGERKRKIKNERGRGKAWHGGHAIIKEGKAFAVLFGDLTSHYPIRPGPPPSLSPRSATKEPAAAAAAHRTEILYAHRTLHCRFLFSLAIAVLRF